MSGEDPIARHQDNLGEPLSDAFGLKNFEELQVGAVDAAAKLEAVGSCPFEADRVNAEAPACDNNMVARSRADRSLDRGLRCANLACH